MNIIFIHQNFPGQYRHLVKQCLADGQSRIVGICQPHAPGVEINKTLKEQLFASIHSHDRYGEGKARAPVLSRQ